MKQKELQMPAPFATVENMTAALRALGVEQGDVLLVHAAMSAIGWVCGGAEAVVLALREAVGESGTLVVPTQSGENSDPAHWSNPAVPEEWQQLIRQHTPAYNPATTPTRQMGAVAEMVRHWPGTLRSSHPSASFAAVGPKAEEILKDQPLQDPMGEAGPLGALYRLGAKVLLLGVNYENCTALHLAEHRAGVTGTAPRAAAVMENGQRVWKRWTGVTDDDRDFPLLGAAYESAGFGKKGQVGEADARLLDLPALVDFGASWLRDAREKAYLTMPLQSDMEKDYKRFMGSFEKVQESPFPAEARLQPVESFSAFRRRLTLLTRRAFCKAQGMERGWFYVRTDRQGRVYGALLLRVTDETKGEGHLCLAVRPSQRWKGHGTALLRDGILFAKSQGVKSLQLYIPQPYEAAQKMAAAVGATPVVPSEKHLAENTETTAAAPFKGKAKTKAKTAGSDALKEHKKGGAKAVKKGRAKEATTPAAGLYILQLEPSVEGIQ